MKKLPVNKEMLPLLFALLIIPAGMLSIRAAKKLWSQNVRTVDAGSFSTPEAGLRHSVTMLGRILRRYPKTHMYVIEWKNAGVKYTVCYDSAEQTLWFDNPIRRLVSEQARTEYWRNVSRQVIYAMASSGKIDEAMKSHGAVAEP